MEPNNIVDAVKEGSKFGTKLSEIALKIYGPRATKRQADADAYADAKKLQTIRDNPDMDIVFIDGKINARAKTPDALAGLAERRQLQESIRQEGNIEKIFEIAAGDTSDKDHIIEDDVDEDWIIRFFDYAKNINDENMQLLWGKILSEEIKQPNSFSLRTIDVVRNISKEEAQRFQKILPLILCNGTDEFVILNELLLKKYGVSYGDILSLEDCGLMNSSVAQITLDVFGSARWVFNNTEHAVMYIENNAEDKIEKISYPVYMFTKAGRELKKALAYDSNLKYLVEAAREVRKKNRNISLSIHKTVIKPDGKLECMRESIMTVSD